MSEFIANNGATVIRDFDSGTGWYSTIVRTVDNEVRLAGSHVGALREFFQYERDAKLGRWRWPENPDYVVYPNGGLRPDDPDSVGVLCEASGMSWTIRADCAAPGEDDWSGAVIAYFDAHPDPATTIPSEPRTAWVDKYGTDVWHVGPDGVLRCVLSPSSDPRKYAPFTRLVPEVKS